MYRILFHFFRPDLPLPSGAYSPSVLAYCRLLSPLRLWPLTGSGSFERRLVMGSHWVVRCRGDGAGPADLAWSYPEVSSLHRRPEVVAQHRTPWRLSNRSY